MNKPKVVVASALLTASILGLAAPLAEAPQYRYLHASAFGAGIIDLEAGKKDDTLVLVWATCINHGPGAAPPFSCSYEVFVHWLEPPTDGSLNVLATTRVMEFKGKGGPVVRRLFYDVMDNCYRFELEEPVSKAPYGMYLWPRGPGKYEVFEVRPKTG